MDKFDERQKFLVYLEGERSASPHTIRNYGADLREFFGFLNGKSLSEVDTLVIRGFLAHLKSRRHSQSTLSRKLSSLRSFFKYLARENRLPSNPLLGVSTPKRGKKLPQFLDLSEVTHLLEAPPAGTWEGKRDRSILEALYSSGVRVSELVGLNQGDVDLLSSLLKIRGKGKKERMVPIGEKAVQAIRDYWESLPPALRRKNEGPQTPVFLNRSGSRLTDRHHCRGPAGVGPPAEGTGCSWPGGGGGPGHRHGGVSDGPIEILLDGKLDRTGSKTLARS